MTSIDIVDYEAQYRQAFEQLNLEWLERYFRVETIDRQILEEPEKRVIAAGGAILFAREGGEILGTVALKHHGSGEFELTKMAVTVAAQGKGIGRRLLDAALERFEGLGGRRLYLESHSSLDRALRLYERAGFEHTARPSPSEYERSDIYMVYRGRKGRNDLRTNASSGTSPAPGRASAAE